MKKRFFSIFLVSIMIISLTGCGKEKLDSPEKIASKYCDILVKGNYGDILDIADMPSNEFTTQEKIDGAKDNFRERFMKDNDDATSCTYTLASENDEKASYKLVINDSKTKTIDIKKSNNKVIIEDIYIDADIYSPIGSTVSMGGTDISKYKVDDNDNIYGDLDHYKITILYDDNSSIEASHPLLTSTLKGNLGSDSKRIVFPYNFSADNEAKSNNYTTTLEKDSTIKKNDFEEIKKLIDDEMPLIVKAIFENQDITKYNYYFNNKDVSNITSLNAKKLSDNMELFNIELIGKDKVIVAFTYGTYDNGMPTSCYITLIKSKDTWKIEKITNTPEI